MLINTVILFLSNSLAIFIVLALLVSLKSKAQLSNLTLYIGAASGLFLMLLLWFFVDMLAQAFDGTGLEWFYTSAYLLVYLLVINLIKTLKLSRSPVISNVCNDVSSQSIKTKLSFYTASVFALIITLQGTSFLIYFIGYWSQENVAYALFIGIVLGAGICISIGILWYFLCHFLNKNIYNASSEFLLILFSCGLLNKASHLLQQIDILPSSRIVWDVNFLIEESAELGQFLSSLFGYDASPTLVQIIIYFIALLTALLWCQLTKPWPLLRIKEVNS